MSSNIAMDKRMTRWEPGVDFGKLVSLFSSSKKDTKPSKRPQPDPSSSSSGSSRPQPGGKNALNSNPTQTGGLFASDRRDGRPTAGTPTGMNPIRQPEAFAGTAGTSGQFSPAALATSGKGKGVGGPSGRDARPDPRSNGAPARSPLSRNPSFPPTGQAGPGSYNNINSRTSGRSPTGELSGLSPAPVAGKGKARENSTTARPSADLSRKTPSGSSFAEREAQIEQQRRLQQQQQQQQKEQQQQTGKYHAIHTHTHEHDSVSGRHNKGARMAVPEIRVTEPAAFVEREQRSNAQQVAVGKSGGKMSKSSPEKNHHQQQQEDTSTRSKQGLGIFAAKKTPTEAQPSSSYVPFGNTQRVPNRSEMSVQDMPLPKDMSKPSSPAERSENRLDSRTNRSGQLPAGVPHESHPQQSQQRSNWNPFSRDHSRKNSGDRPSEKPVTGPGDRVLDKGKKQVVHDSRLQSQPTGQTADIESRPQFGQPLSRMHNQQTHNTQTSQQGGSHQASRAQTVQSSQRNAEPQLNIAISGREKSFSENDGSSRQQSRDSPLQMSKRRDEYIQNAVMTTATPAATPGQMAADRAKEGRGLPSPLTNIQTKHERMGSGDARNTTSRTNMPARNIIPTTALETSKSPTDKSKAMFSPQQAPIIIQHQRGPSGNGQEDSRRPGQPQIRVDKQKSQPVKTQGETRNPPVKALVNDRDQTNARTMPDPLGLRSEHPNGGQTREQPRAGIPQGGRSPNEVFKTAVSGKQPVLGPHNIGTQEGPMSHRRETSRDGNSIKDSTKPLSLGTRDAFARMLGKEPSKETHKHGAQQAGSSLNDGKKFQAFTPIETSRPESSEPARQKTANKDNTSSGRQEKGRAEAVQTVDQSQNAPRPFAVERNGTFGQIYTRPREPEVENASKALSPAIGRGSARETESIQQDVSSKHARARTNDLSKQEKPSQNVPREVSISEFERATRAPQADLLASKAQQRNNASATRAAVSPQEQQSFLSTRQDGSGESARSGRKEAERHDGHHRRQVSSGKRRDNDVGHQSRAADVHASAAQSQLAGDGFLRNNGASALQKSPMPEKSVEATGRNALGRDSAPKTTATHIMRGPATSSISPLAALEKLAKRGSSADEQAQSSRDKPFGADRSLSKLQEEDSFAVSQTTSPAVSNNSKIKPEKAPSPAARNKNTSVLQEFVGRWQRGDLYAAPQHDANAPIAFATPHESTGKEESSSRDLHAQNEARPASRREEPASLQPNSNTNPHPVIDKNTNRGLVGSTRPVREQQQLEETATRVPSRPQHAKSTAKQLLKDSTAPRPSDPTQIATNCDGPPLVPHVEQRRGSERYSATEPQTQTDISREVPNTAQRKEIVANTSTRPHAGTLISSDGLASQIAGASHKRGFGDLYTGSSVESENVGGSERSPASPMKEAEPETPATSFRSQREISSSSNRHGVSVVRKPVDPVQPLEPPRYDTNNATSLPAHPITESSPLTPFRKPLVEHKTAEEQADTFAESIARPREGHPTFQETSLVPAPSSSNDRTPVANRAFSTSVSGPPENSFATRFDQDKTPARYAPLKEDQQYDSSYLPQQRPSPGQTSKPAVFDAAASKNAMFAEAAAAEFVGTSKLADAKSRRKSNRMASMYGAQLSLGREEPVPHIPATQARPRDMLPQRPDFSRSDSTEAVITLETVAPQLGQASRAEPSEQKLEGADFGGHAANSNAKTAFPQVYTPAEKKPARPATPNASKTTRDSVLTADLAPPVPMIDDPEYLRKSQLPAPLSLNASTLNEASSQSSSARGVIKPYLTGSEDVRATSSATKDSQIRHPEVQHEPSRLVPGGGAPLSQSQASSSRNLLDDGLGEHEKNDSRDLFLFDIDDMASVLTSNAMYREEKPESHDGRQIKADIRSTAPENFQKPSFSHDMAPDSKNHLDEAVEISRRQLQAIERKSPPVGDMSKTPAQPHHDDQELDSGVASRDSRYAQGSFAPPSASGRKHDQQSDDVRDISQPIYSDNFVKLPTSAEISGMNGSDDKLSNASGAQMRVDNSFTVRAAQVEEVSSLPHTAGRHMMSAVDSAGDDGLPNQPTESAVSPKAHQVSESSSFPGAIRTPVMPEFTEQVKEHSLNHEASPIGSHEHGVRRPEANASEGPPDSSTIRSDAIVSYEPDTVTKARFAVENNEIKSNVRGGGTHSSEDHLHREANDDLVRPAAQRSPEDMAPKPVDPPHQVGIAVSRVDRDGLSGSPFDDSAPSPAVFQHSAVEGHSVGDEQILLPSSVSTFAHKPSSAIDSVDNVFDKPVFDIVLPAQQEESLVPSYYSESQSEDSRSGLQNDTTGVWKTRAHGQASVSQSTITPGGGSSPMAKEHPSLLNHSADAFKKDEFENSEPTNSTESFHAETVVPSEPVHLQSRDIDDIAGTTFSAEVDHARVSAIAVSSKDGDSPACNAANDDGLYSHKDVYISCYPLTRKADATTRLPLSSARPKDSDPTVSDYLQDRVAGPAHSSDEDTATALVSSSSRKSLLPAPFKIDVLTCHL